jgi:hypothetical protein
MDTRYQPEGLSFDGSNNFNPNFNNSDRGQFPLNGQQKDQHSAQSVPPPFTPPPQQTATYGAQPAPRLGSPQQGRQSNGLPTHPRQFTPQPGQQGDVYSRGSYPQQQQPPMSQYNVQSGPPQGQFSHSRETTRTDTWLQTPAGPYPSDEGYFPGPVDVNGYPIDTKGKQPDTENPFNDPPKAPAPAKTSVTITDLEKHDHDEKHGHGGWE